MRAKFIENKPFSPNSSYSGGNVRNGRDRAQLRSCSCGLSSAGDDLDSVSRNKLSAILHLESNVLQLKRPDFIAETVGIEAALESQPGPDLVLQDLGNRAVEIGQDLHGELRIDVVLGDEVIKRICERAADAMNEGTEALVSKVRAI